YGVLSGRLAEVTAALETLRRALQQEFDQTEGTERQLAEVEETLAQIDEAVRVQEARHAEARDQITRDTAVLGAESARSAEKQSESEKMSAQVVELTLCAAAVLSVVTEAGR